MASRKTKKPYNPLLPTPTLPAFGTTPILPHSLPIIFRLSRPRTWAFPTISFLLGYTVTGWGSLLQATLGLGVACLVTAATNIVNAYADRREDAVNQPSRVFWVDRIGSKGALGSSLIFYSSAVTLGIYLGPLFLLVLGIGIFNSLAYSLPPLRFKAHPIPSLVSFSGAVGLAFLSGLAARGSLDLSSPLLWLATFFMFTYGTVKNLPDYSGDRKAGTRTTATIFKNIKSAVLFTGTLLYTPYIILTALILLGTLPPVYGLDLGFLVILTIIFQKMRTAKTSQQLERAHTYGFFYAISFLSFTLVLSSPTIESITALLAAYAWTLLVSKIHIDSRRETRDWERGGRNR